MNSDSAIAKRKKKKQVKLGCSCLYCCGWGLVFGKEQKKIIKKNQTNPKITSCALNE